MKFLILIFFLFLSCVSIGGETPSFQNLTSEQAKGVLKDFAAVFMPTSVSPASSHGKFWGIEAGVIAGTVESPHINKLVSEDVEKLPHAAALVAVHLPFGLGAEITTLPLKVEDYEFSSLSVAAKWTISDVFKVIPFDTKLRLRKSTAEMKFKDDNLIGDIYVTAENKTTSYDITLSKKLLFIEPFVGYGYVDGESDLTATANTIFSDANEASLSTGVDTSGNYYFGGLQLNIFVLKVAAEYMKVFNVEKVSAKISLAI